MKRELIVGAVALSGVVVAALFVQDAVERYDLWPAGDAVVAASPTPEKNKAPKSPKNAQEMTVTWVYDGDTIQARAKNPGRYVNITGKVDVRLIGVDAPELKPKAECYGKKSTAFLKALLPVGTKILVAPDKDSWDDYNRRLFYVWKKKGQDMVSYEIARTGHAPAIRVWPNVEHFAVLKEANTRALEARRGMWVRC